MGFALFGLTKAGKTTFAHYLVSNHLKGKQLHDTVVYESDDPNRMKEAKIGQTHESETVIPNRCNVRINIDGNNQEVTVLDCPGYQDSKGCEMIIANAYFHYRIFSKVKKLKFVLVFDSNTMDGVYEKPRQTIRSFLNSFDMDSPKQFQEIF